MSTGEPTFYFRPMPALRFDPTRLPVLLRPTSPRWAAMVTVLLVVGTAVSMVTTTDTSWWRSQFSELGTFHDFSGHTFNATMILVGMLFLGFSLQVRRDMHALQDLRGAKRSGKVSVLLACSGAHLAGVGFFPMNVNQFMHERAADGIIFSFLGVLITVVVRRRHYTRPLMVFTYILGGTLVTTTVVYLFKLMTLAAFELVAFALIFTWIGVFAARLHRTLTETRHRQQHEAAAVGDTTPTADDIVPTARPTQCSRRDLRDDSTWWIAEACGSAATVSASSTLAAASAFVPRLASRRSRAPSTRLYSVGSTSSVSTVDDTRPPMTTIASGCEMNPPCPVMPRAMGVNAKMVASAVMRIGRRRLDPPAITASWVDRPLARYWLTRSTSTMAFVTTMPMSISTPMRDATPSGTPVISCSRIAPVAANGIDTSSSSGWRNDLNVATITT